MMNIRDPDTEEEVEKELLPPNPNMPTDDDAFKSSTRNSKLYQKRLEYLRLF